MKGKKVVYNNEIYIVLYDYKNGQIEIKKENSSSLYNDVKLVRKRGRSMYYELKRQRKRLIIFCLLYSTIWP